MKIRDLTIIEGNDGNLANNAKPYNKVTRGDVIAGRLGKDEMGGKKKADKKIGEANYGKMIAPELAQVIRAGEPEAKGFMDYAREFGSGLKRPVKGPAPMGTTAADAAHNADLADKARAFLPNATGLNDKAVDAVLRSTAPELKPGSRAAKAAIDDLADAGKKEAALAKAQAQGRLPNPSQIKPPTVQTPLQSAGRVVGVAAPTTAIGAATVGGYNALTKKTPTSADDLPGPETANQDALSPSLNLNNYAPAQQQQQESTDLSTILKLAGQRPITERDHRAGITQVQPRRSLRESAQLEECGMDMGSPDRPATINISAGSADELADLLRLIGNAEGGHQPHVVDGMDMDHPGAIEIDGTMDAEGARELADMLAMSGQHGHGHEEMAMEVYDNSPEEKVYPYNPNQFSHIINKVRDFSNEPNKFTGTNPLKKEHQETVDQPIVENNDPMAQYKDALMKAWVSRRDSQ